MRGYSAAQERPKLNTLTPIEPQRSKYPLIASILTVPRKSGRWAPSLGGSYVACGL